MHSTRPRQTGSTLPNLALFSDAGSGTALDGPEAGRFVMPTETTCRHWCSRHSAHGCTVPGPIDSHVCGSRSNPVNGSRIVTFEPSPSVCAAAEIVWISSSVRLP